MVIYARRLLTPLPPAPVAGRRMAEVQEFSDVDVVVDELSGKIVDIRRHTSADIGAKLVTPAFFDAHTHIPFVGSRAFEFLMRARGKRYVDILKAGGGIHYTARFVREASLEELFTAGKRHVEMFLKHGVVGIECKSGYGLTPEAELKQLEVIQALKNGTPAKIVPTFLGLHARPTGSEEDVENFIARMASLLETIRLRDLAVFVDAFCDEGAYSPSEVRKFAEVAVKKGFKLRLHADEISNVGATMLGIELGASSVDHCLKIGEPEIVALSGSSTMVTLMPATSFYLNEGYAPARRLIDAGVPVALGSDFNPGSCPVFQPSFVMHLAIRFLQMELPEVLTAYTINSAHLLGLNSGTVQPGFYADLVLWSTEDLADVPYMFQENFVEHVLVNGRIVF